MNGLNEECFRALLIEGSVGHSRGKDSASQSIFQKEADVPRVTQSGSMKVVGSTEETLLAMDGQDCSSGGSNDSMVS